MNANRIFWAATLLIIVAFFSFMLLPGCATMQKVTEFLNPQYPESVKTVILSELIFRGSCVGVKVPEKYGDFSLGLGTRMILKVAPISMNMVLIEILNSDGTEYFQLFGLAHCPKIIALRVLIKVGKDDWLKEYWIYNLAGEPEGSTDEEVNEFIKLEHNCPKEV